MEECNADKKGPRRKRYRVENGDLSALIKTHLFVIAPNNSGSTFLTRALASSENTWNLEREGQHIEGFHGPSTRETEARLLWASSQNWLDLFQNPKNYNWKETQKAWYRQATSVSPYAQIFVGASPPFLLYLDSLRKHFAYAKFLIMVRDPYATIEGIYRRTMMQSTARSNVNQSDGCMEDAILQKAAIHVMNCLRFQRQNREAYSHCSVFFTYEQMCDETDLVLSKIQNLIPELKDLGLDQKIALKNYDEPLRNMNKQQINSLSEKQHSLITELVRPERDLIEFFGYKLG